MKKDKKYPISDRWTEDILSWGFAPIANVFLDNYTLMGMTNMEALVVIHLMRYKWDKNHPFPSYGTLSEKVGLHHRRLRQIVKDLETKGFLKRIERRKPLHSQTNLFDLTPLFDSLEEVIRMGKQLPVETDTAILLRGIGVPKLDSE